MATTIDSRVVEMRFDNAQFEKGVNQSIGTLDKLKSSLNFDDLNQSVKSTVNPAISSIGDTIETVANKLNSVINIVRNTAIAKYASKILNVFSSIRKSLSTDMMVAGWSKYEELMSSTQTIMFATRDQWEDQGAQMEFIEGQLEKLMWYTDETSYDFADMANNIGKFTAAGVGLEDSVSAMMGISSWAAISGKNAQAASVAMYNLSQALAVGAVTAADWKSIELQNMATEEFKQTVIDTAVAMGKLEEGEVDVLNFRTSLKDKWFDNEVLLTVLKKYGDFSMQLNEAVEETGLTASEFRGYIQDFKDGVITLDDLGTVIDRDGIDDPEGFVKWMGILTDEYYDLGFEAFKAGQECKTFTDVVNATKDALSTGWLKTFKALTGNYLQSKELWSGLAEDIYDLFVEPLNARNDILKEFNENGGRDAAIEGLLNLWHMVLDVILEVRDAYDKAFPRTTADQLKQLVDDFLEKTQGIRNAFDNLNSKLKYTERIGTNIGTFVKNISITLTSIRTAFAQAWTDIFPKASYETIIGNIFEKVVALTENLRKLSEIFYVDMAEGADNVNSRYMKLVRTFRGMAAIVDIVKQLIIAIIKPFRKTKLESVELGDGILDITAAWGDWLVALDNTIRETGVFDKAVSKVIEFFQKLPTYVNNATQALFKMDASEVWDKIVAGATLAVGALASLVIENPEDPDNWDIVKVWENIKSNVQETWDKIVYFATHIPDKIHELYQLLFGEHELDEGARKFSILDFIDMIKGAYEAIGKFFGWIQDYDENGFEKTSPFERFIMWFEEAWKEFKGKLTDIGAQLQPVGDWISENILTKEGMDDLAKILKTAGILGSIAAILFLIYQIVVKIANIASMLKGTKDIASAGKGGLFKKIAEVFGPIGYLQDMAGIAKTGFTNMTKLVKGGYFAMMGLFVLELASALLILSYALSKHPVETVAAFVILTHMVVGMFYGAIQLMRRQHFTGDNIKQLGLGFALIGFMFVEIAGSLWLIANAFSGLSIDKIIATVGALLLVFGAIGGIFILFDKGFGQKIDADRMWTVAGAFVIMGSCMIEIAAALWIVATAFKWLSFSQIIGTVLALVLVFGAMGGMFIAMDKLTGKTDTMIDTAMAFAILGVSLIEIALALKLIAGYNFEELLPGLVALGVIMVLFAALAAISVFTNGKFAEALVAIGLAFLLFGAGLALVGAGIWLAVEGIAKFLELGPEGLVAMGDAILYIFSEIIPKVIPLAGEAFRQFLEELVKSKPQVKAWLISIGKTIIETLKTLIPDIMDLLGDFFEALLDLGIKLMPKLTDLVLKIFDFILVTSIDSILKLGELIWTTTIGLLRMARDNVGELVELLVEIGIEMVLGLLDGIAQEADDIVDSAFNFVISWINAISDGIDKHAKDLHDACEKLKRSIIRGICIAFGIPVAPDGKLNKDAKSKEFKGVGDVVAGSAEQGITDKVNEVFNTIKEAGKKIINAFMEGMKVAGGVVYEGAKSLGASVIDGATGALDVNSPSKVMFDIGKNVDEGFANGIDYYANEVFTSAEDVAKTATDGFNEAISNLTEGFKEEMDLFPTITPIIDLSYFTDGIGSMSDMLLGMAGVDMGSLTGGGFNANLAVSNSRGADLAALAQTLSSDDGTTIGNTTNNTFNITGDDPKQIAQEISNILQRQMERRTAVWGY